MRTFPLFSFSCLTGKTPALKLPSSPNTVIVKYFSAEIAISVNFLHTGVVFIFPFRLMRLIGYSAIWLIDARCFFYQYPRSNSEPIIIRPPADVDETSYDFINYITGFGGYGNRQQDSAPLNDSNSSLEDCDLDSITPVRANIIYNTFFKTSKFSQSMHFMETFANFPPTGSYFDWIFGSILKKERKKEKPAFNLLTHGLIFCQFTLCKATPRSWKDTKA